MTTTLAIELCDAAFLAAIDSGPVVAPSPGYALLEGKELLVGRQAQASARLRPRWVDNRFWDQLSTEPMPRPFPRGLSRADVAHAHLLQIWGEIQEETGAGAETASVLLVAPGSFSVDQLGLILGMARAGGIPVSGMVDAALAAVAPEVAAPRLLHLDVLLHSWVWTELRHDGELARQRVEVLGRGGLVKIWDAWAKRIAELLVRQTRFDPFHHGRAEQSLYDRLPEWLESLTRQGHVQVTLESGDKQRTVELDGASAAVVTGELLAPVTEMARLLVSSDERPIVALSSRAAGVPGLAAALSRSIDTGVIDLDEGAATRGALTFGEQIESPASELPFVTRLPAELRAEVNLAPADRAPSPSSFAAQRPAPTHVLFDGYAFPIDGEPLWLGAAIEEGVRGIGVGGPMPGLSRMHCTLCRQDARVFIEDHSRYGTYLNGTRILGRTECAVGDRIRLGSPGVELLLITVAKADV